MQKGRGSIASGSVLGQAAIDFLTSYGIALLVIAIAIAIAYEVSSATTYAFSSQCSPQPGFACGYYSISDNGILSIGVAQAVGAAIQVNGLACSTRQSAAGMPEYGNIYVANSIPYYPLSYAPPAGGVVIQSSGETNFKLYCYLPGNAIATSTLPGSSFVGYLWLNYTIENTNIHTVQEIAALGLRYVVS